MLFASIFYLSSGAETDEPTKPIACRNPLQQPFSASSIWNTPLGEEAVLVDAGLSDFATGQFHVDTNYVVPTGEEVVDVVDQGWWGPTPAAGQKQCPVANKSNTWCHCTVFGNRSGTTLGIPHDFTTADGAGGVDLSSGNNGALFMINATHALEMQPTYRCTPGSPVLSRWKQWMLDPPTGPKDRHLKSLWSEGTYGSHGGTGLSSLGGQIRRGELNQSAPPIQHALSFELFAHKWYYCDNSTNRSTCFRWPAMTADGYAVDPKSDLVYNGTNPQLKAGALLAVPASLVPTVQASLSTVVGARILHAVSTFGAYLVDDAAGTYLGDNGKTNINYEQGVDAEVLANYGLQLSASPKDGRGPSAIYSDLTAIFQALKVVSNNRPESIGGGGKSVVAPPPQLCPEPPS
jgi:hypothetical protein